MNVNKDFGGIHTEINRREQEVIYLNMYFNCNTSFVLKSKPKYVSVKKKEKFTFYRKFSLW